jgi:hypothetical protein
MTLFDGITKKYKKIENEKSLWYEYEDGDNYGVFPEAEKKWKWIIEKINHFPSLILGLIKKLKVGYLMITISILISIFLFFLIKTDSIKLVYFNFQLSSDNDDITYLTKSIADYNTKLFNKNSHYDCIKKQIERITSQQPADINFCK